MKAQLSYFETNIAYVSKGGIALSFSDMLGMSGLVNVCVFTENRGPQDILIHRHPKALPYMALYIHLIQKFQYQA